MPFKPLFSLDLVYIGQEKEFHRLGRKLRPRGYRLSGFHPMGSPYLSPAAGEGLPPIRLACQRADLILMRMNKEEMRHLAYTLDDLRTKAVLDLSALPAFLGTRISGPAMPVHNGIEILATIAGCKETVKIYGPTGYETLIDPCFIPSDLILAGSSSKAKQLVELLLRDLRLGEIYDLGDASMIRHMDGLISYLQNREATPEA